MPSSTYVIPSPRPNTNETMKIFFFKHAKKKYMRLSFLSLPVVIVPGFGGSVLRDIRQNTTVWPSFPLLSKSLDVVWKPDVGLESVYPLDTLPLGERNGIKVDTLYTYMLTKNSFYSPLLQKLKEQNATVSVLPYDFRLMKDLSTPFLQFFEAQPQPSVVICHSLGGLLFHHFLATRTDAAWQKKYIRRLYFINVPFGGCPEALFVILKNARGARFPFYIDTLHWFAGLYWCLPCMNTGQRILNDYQDTPEDMDRLFHHLQLPHRSLMGRSLEHRTLPLHVPTFIVHGSHIRTPVFWDETTQTRRYEDGDGIVPLSSLLYYGKGDHNAYYIEIQGMKHDRVSDCLGLFDFIGPDALPPQNHVFTFPEDFIL